MIEISLENHEILLPSFIGHTDLRSWPIYHGAAGHKVENDILQEGNVSLRVQLVLVNLGFLRDNQDFACFLK